MASAIWSGDEDEEMTSLDEDMRARDVSTIRSGAAAVEDVVEGEGTEIYLSVLWSGGKLGVAYYDAVGYQLHILPMDTADAPPQFLNLGKVLQMSRPRVVLVWNKQDSVLLDALKKMTNYDVDASETSSSSTVQLMPSTDFDVGSCRRRLVQLTLPHMPVFADEVSRLIYMSDLFNFNDIAMVRSAGALLKYLDRKRINVELENEEKKTPIVAVNRIKLADLVSVDRDTYKALQIFKKVWHPSVYKISGGGREGFSLFGLFSQCKSSLGNQEMERIFWQPTRDLDVIGQRHLAIRFLLQPSNDELVATFQNHLKNIRNVTKIVTKMNETKTTIGEWQKFYETAYHAAKLADICRNAKLPTRINVFQNIMETFTQDLVVLATVINAVIDFAESHETNRFVVKHGVDSDLDEKKRIYESLPNLMTTVARKELQRLSHEIEECNVVYIPQLGYLLSIPMTQHMRTTEDYQLPNLTFTFTSNDKVYYKSQFTTELDSSLGDTRNDILDLELQIMLKLQLEVLKHCQVMVDVMRHSAQLDCLIAMAKVAKEFGYVQPTVNHSDVICIRKGRHPLQELRTTTFVPNDVVSGGAEASKMLILTGPNSSGKSVYLKQVSLIVFLAQIGSFVPAESAVVGLVDAIYTRMYTSESVSTGLSTFKIDLNQISLATRCATQRSLVIIDEFGKGTNAVDGMALLAATLNYWIDQPQQCPHVFVSTHIYGVIKWLHESPIVSFKTLETLLEGEELIYFYRLIDGVGSFSYASLIAKKAGFSDEDYIRSLEVTKALCDGRPIPRRLDFRNKIYEKARQEVEQFLQLDLTNETEVSHYFQLLREELEERNEPQMKSAEAENPFPFEPNTSSA